MHVALYSPSWPLARYPNGVVTYVHWMREALRAQGHEVSIFAATMDADWQEAGVHKIVSTPLMRCWHWLRNRVPACRDHVRDWGEELAGSIRRVHATRPIDVIEIEESFGLFGQLAERLDIPVVVKLHGPAFLSLIEDELGTPAADRKIAAEGQALSRSRAVMSPSRDVLDRTLQRYKIRPPICEHVVNPLTLPASAPVWDLASCDRKTILFVGRFDKRKGGDLVLLAFEQLLRDDPALKLVFIGPDFGVEGPGGALLKFDEFKRQVFDGRATPQIDFLGRQGSAEIAAQRGRAMVTVIASRWENQSYTALEAMLQGCPVVSTDCGGQGEFVRHGSTGLLARTDDVGDLRDKIAELLAAPERASELGRAARAHVLEHHSPEVVAGQTLAVYQRAPARQGQPLMFENVRTDLRAHGGDWAAQGFWALLVYRFGRWRYGIRWVPARKLCSMIYKVMFKFVQIVTGIELPCEVVLGRNFVIDHFGGIVVSGYARFGDNCRIRNGVVVGLGRVEEPGAPSIGNNVDIGTGAKVLGRIVIGDNVLIGANAVVIRDVPANSIAVGVPAVVKPRSVA